MKCSEEGAICPSASLLEENREALRWVGKCLAAGHVLEYPVGGTLDQNLETHDPVLSQVHVGLRGCVIFFVHAAKKTVERPALDTLPAKHGECAWEHAHESKERLKSLVKVMRDLVLNILRRNDCVFDACEFLEDHDFYLSAYASHLWLKSAIFEIDPLYGKVPTSMSYVSFGCK